MRFSGFLFRPLLALLLLAGCASVQAQGTQFAQPTVIPTGNWPAAIYTADVNGDGFPDLIYIDQGATPAAATTHILLNDGKGNFKQSATLATAGQSLAIGNLFGRGHVDIAWASRGAQYGPTGFGLTMAAGNGDGTFAGSYPLQLTEQNATKPFLGGYLTAIHNNGSGFNSASTVLVQDVNNNELIGSIYPYGTLPTGFGFTVPYSASTSLPSGTGPVWIADLNGDGYPDVIINNPANGTVTSLLTSPRVFGFGAGLTAPVVALAGSATSILLQDVNQDGRPDLIAEGANGRIDVFPGNGDGTFSATSIGGTGSLDGLSGNGGQLIGLSLLPNTHQPVAFTATPAGISTLLSQGNASFSLNGIYNAGPGRTSYALADFNGDGILDLAVDSPEGIAILYGNADGSFQTSQAFAAGQPALAAAVGAFTTGQKLDVAVATAATQAQMLLGQGDGTFLAAPTPITPQTGPAGLWSSVNAADLDGDGQLDLVLTADGANANLPAGGSGIAVQLGNGDGTFGPPTAPKVADQFTKPAPSSCSPPFDHFPGLLYGTSVVADFTGDGLADVANRDSGAYRILLGNNGSVAQSYSRYPTLFFAGADGSSTVSDCNLNAHQLVAQGDLNHDGRPDLIYQSNGSLLVYLTDSTGSPYPIGDLAQDGSLTTPGQLTAPDLAANFGGQSAALGFPAAIGSMVIADLDGDGNQDLLVLYANLAEDPGHPGPQGANRNWLYVWYGSGNGKFLTSAAHPQNPVRVQPSRDFYQMAVGKLDSSGKPLLAMSDGYVLSVGTLGAEQHLLAGQGINAITVADLRGTGQQDLVLANGGLTLANPVANHEMLTPNPDVNTGGVTVLLNSAPMSLPALSGTLAANPEPSVAGNDYTLTLTLTPGTAGPVPTGSVPTGPVQFSVNSVPLGGLVALTPNANGSTSASISDNSGRLPGSYQLTAAYSGDSHYAASVTQSTHNVVLSPTVATLTASTPLTVSYGQPVNYIFAVTGLSTGHAPGGVYTVLDNGVNALTCRAIPVAMPCAYGSSPLLETGQHVLTAHYQGDAYNAPSDSAPLTYTVQASVTTATLSVSPNPSIFGQTVTFRQTVSSNPLPPSALASIETYDGATLIGTGQALIVSNPAVFTTSTLSVGTHTLTFVYTGTANFTRSVSNTVVQVVVATSSAPTLPAASFLMDVTPASASVVTGQMVSFTVKITAHGGFNQPVQLSCGNLPSETRCMFLPALIPAAGGSGTMQTATMQVSASAASNCGDPGHPNYLAADLATKGTILPFLASAALLAMAYFRRKNRMTSKLLRRLALSCLLGSLLLNLGGCGNCLDPGTRPGSYTFTVIGTAQGGPTVQTVTQQVPLTVTLK